jgi:hypothetical protein
MWDVGSLDTCPGILDIILPTPLLRGAMIIKSMPNSLSISFKLPTRIAR